MEVLLRKSITLLSIIFVSPFSTECVVDSMESTDGDENCGMNVAHSGAFVTMHHPLP
jgi:hypothetical protein